MSQSKQRQIHDFTADIVNGSIRGSCEQYTLLLPACMAQYFCEHMRLAGTGRSLNKHEFINIIYSVGPGAFLTTVQVYFLAGKRTVLKLKTVDTKGAVNGF